MSVQEKHKNMMGIASGLRNCKVRHFFEDDIFNAKHRYDISGWGEFGGNWSLSYPEMFVYKMAFCTGMPLELNIKNKNVYGKAHLRPGLKEEREELANSVCKINYRKTSSPFESVLGFFKEIGTDNREFIKKLADCYNLSLDEKIGTLISCGHETASLAERKSFNLFLQYTKDFLPLYYGEKWNPFYQKIWDCGCVKIPSSANIIQPTEMTAESISEAFQKINIEASKQSPYIAGWAIEKLKKPIYRYPNRYDYCSLLIRHNIFENIPLTAIDTSLLVLDDKEIYQSKQPSRLSLKKAWELCSMVLDDYGLPNDLLEKAALGKISGKNTYPGLVHAHHFPTRSFLNRYDCSNINNHNFLWFTSAPFNLSINFPCEKKVAKKMKEVLPKDIFRERCEKYGLIEDTLVKTTGKIAKPALAAWRESVGS